MNALYIRSKCEGATKFEIFKTEFDYSPNPVLKIDYLKSGMENITDLDMLFINYPQYDFEIFMSQENDRIYEYNLVDKSWWIIEISPLVEENATILSIESVPLTNHVIIVYYIEALKQVKSKMFKSLPINKTMVKFYQKVETVLQTEVETAQQAHQYHITMPSLSFNQSPISEAFTVGFLPKNVPSVDIELTYMVSLS
jgi:uncharacterized protein YqgQ